jgi:hypothetical protein
MLLLVLLCALAMPAQSALYMLQDGARPALKTDGTLLSWWEGGPAFTVASAGSVFTPPFPDPAQ